jgi:hypothetical protein
VSAPIGSKARGLFLEGLAVTCNVTAAPGRTRHDRGSFYRLRETDADFRAPWEEAIDRLEAQAFKTRESAGRIRTEPSPPRRPAHDVRQNRSAPTRTG